MSDNQGKQPQKEQPLLLINGHEATEKEYKRIMQAHGAQKSSQDSTATKPLHSVTRGFQLLK